VTVRRLVVVGGGIAGLAAAWAAAAQAETVPGGLEVVVLERDSEVGGKARSLTDDGWLVEAGPATFLDGTPELDRLIRESGIGDEVEVAAPVGSRRYVFHGSKIREIVPSPFGLLRSRLLTTRGLLRLLLEPFVPARRVAAPDESVWSFAARRLGPEVADRLVRPMTLGVFAGDADRLSVGAAFPRMVALERDHGSLIRAMVARRKGPRSRRQLSFRGGMQSLPRALARSDRFVVRRGATVVALRRSDAGWRVAVAGDQESVPADAVVLAGEPFAMAPLVRDHADSAAAELNAIDCPPVAVVALGFGPEIRQSLPVGFGMLIARGEGFRMLGNVWDSSLFGGRSPGDQVLIRAIYGGAVDREAATLAENELAALARDEVRRIYGLESTSVFTRVVRWPRAIPQYELGHLGRVTRIEGALDQLPGVFAAGSGLHGISFPDAAASGVRSGERAARWLSRGRP
jgi:oxygen-dependent protoporphyrinogen oxidase